MKHMYKSPTCDNIEYKMRIAICSGTGGGSGDMIDPFSNAPERRNGPADL